jgi:serine/threonine protein kinase
MAAPKPPPDPAQGEEPKIDYVPLEDVEDLEYYEKGGYHPVKIGDILHEKYRIVHKLGFGTYGTIWLAVDQTSRGFVAIKVGRAKQSNLLEATSIKDLQHAITFDTSTIRSVIPPLLDNFDIDGPNGKHPCYVTTVGGANLSLAKLKCHQGVFRLDVARAMAAQLVIAVAHVHEKGTVHGDVTLRNVILRLPFDINKFSVDALYEKFGKPVRLPVVREDGKELTSAVPSECIESVWMGKTSDEIRLPDAKIMLIDFGESYRPSLEPRHNSTVPRAYLPPEVLWDKVPLLSFSSDIWTLACSLWDIVAWFPLFESYFSAETENITAEQVSVLGKLPPGWWSTWGRKHEIRRRQFDPEGKTKHPLEYPDMETRFDEAAQNPRRARGWEAMADGEKKSFLLMIRSMLEYRPEKRATAKQVLESEWMKRWAIPEYDKIRGH